MMEYGKRGRLFLLDPFWLWYYTENCSHEMRKRSTFRHIENLFYIIVVCIIYPITHISIYMYANVINV